MLIYIQWFVIILTIIANLFIAFVVYKKNPLSVTNLLIAALATVSVFWTIFNYLALSPSSEEIRLFWVRAVMFVTTPFGSIILLLAIVFPEAKLPIRKSAVV